jgi:hypothetical protein
VNPRTEPLLWIQLLGLAVLPLEALLILVVLAGSTPGPAPLVEEVLCWSLGGLAPALLLWRVPADVWSLLVAQIPARGRRDLQQRLSRLQGSLLLNGLGPGLGAVILLPLVRRLDQHAAIAAPLWTSQSMPRLVALLLGAVLLSLMLWQWQQALQAIWLLGRSEALLRATTPLSSGELEGSRLSLGLPLLLPAPLRFDPPTPPSLVSASGLGPAASPPSSAESSSVAGAPLPVEPEQAPTTDEGNELDEPVG